MYVQLTEYSQFSTQYIYVLGASRRKKRRTTLMNIYEQNEI